MTIKTQHECEISRPHGSYGYAIDYCSEDEQGRFWVGNGEYYSQVKFCPECGIQATNIDLTPDPEPEPKPFVCTCKRIEVGQDGIPRIFSGCWHIGTRATLDHEAVK